MFRKKQFAVLSNSRFISRTNFILSWSEHERSFMTSGPEFYIIEPRHKKRSLRGIHDQKRSRPATDATQSDKSHYHTPVYYLLPYDSSGKRSSSSIYGCVVCSPLCCPHMLWRPIFLVSWFSSEIHFVTFLPWVPALVMLANRARESGKPIYRFVRSSDTVTRMVFRNWRH